MVFWVGILVGGLFAWLAFKMGLYETWAMLFNIVISIYLAVFLVPVIMEIFPAAGGTAYSNVLAMITTAVGAFLILHGICYTFVIGQLNMSFPRTLDTLGAGFLGFLAGFLVWSFVTILVCMTPLSQNKILRGLDFSGQSLQTNISYVCRWCNLVHKAAAFEDSVITSEEAVRGLMEGAKKEFLDEPNEPNKPASL
ncbi:MAG: CvpA family protein [Planctomycetota bacterium]|jgi:hypothetical protein